MHKLRSNFRFWLLRRALKAWIEKDMDQWELWKIESKFGPNYISISAYPTGNKLNYNDIT